MQPNIIERVWRQDKGANVDVLNCFVFTGEAGAHKFVISGKNVNTPVDISGTITANFKNADGVLVPLIGTIEDGKAVVVLSPECYAVEGPFSLVIFADTVCIYAAIANVINSSGEVIAYPTATIPSVQELIEEVQDIIASIPQDYSALNQSVQDLKSAFESNTVSKTNYVQGSRDNTGNVVLSYTRCTTAELWNLRIGDVVNISGTATGQKYVLAGVKNGSFIFDSGWQTENKTFVINADGNYFLNTAATNGTDNITPQSVTTIAELIDNTSRIAYVETNVTALKNGTARSTGATIIDLTKNSVIQNNQSAGAAVDYTNVESSQSGSCAVADCSPGDMFTFYGTGFVNYRLWAFIDSANKMIVNSGMSVTGDGLVVIAPDNAAKIIVNINNGGTVFAGMPVDKRLERVENGTVSESFNIPHCALQGENIGHNLTVMTYNISNYNNDTATYIPAEKLYNLKRALMRAKPDIICTQEDGQYIDSGNTKSSLAYLYNPVLPIVYGEGGPCIRSKFMASHNTAWYDYLMLTGNRPLRTALYEINENIKLLVISAHVVAGTTAENIQARSTQYSELLSWANGDIALTSAASGNQVYAPEHTHCIIGIDANTLTATDKTNLSAYASNANFVLGNGGAIGWFYTNWANGVKTSLDNIICSSNVIINSIEAYGEMYNDLYSDHVPVVANVTLI